MRPFPVWIATVGGVGYVPFAPGTAGSAVGVVLFLALARLGLPLYLLTLLALCFLGVWASDIAGRCFECPDDGRIVVDEVAGQLITLTPLVALSQAWSAGLWGLLLVTGFVLFRLLDIWKPGPVGWAERRFKGGVGVMADDLVAGVLGAGLLTLITAVFPVAMRTALTSAEASLFA